MNEQGIGFLVLIVLILLFVVFIKAGNAMEKYIGRGVTWRLLSPIGTFLMTAIIFVIIFIFIAASM